MIISSGLILWQMTFFKKEPLSPINSSYLTNTMSIISEKIILDFFEKDEHFKFYKTKK